MLDLIVYLLYRAGAALANALPLPLLFAAGQFLGFCAWLILGKYRHLANHNVSIAFGNEKSPRQLRRLVRRHCAELDTAQKVRAQLLKMATDKTAQLRRRLVTSERDGNVAL